MRIKYLYETGSNIALFGLGLSYGLTSDISLQDFIVNNELYNKMKGIADKLAFSDNGENKFLRCITVYLDLDMPLYWWKEFDTYKIGTTAQSESTMHSILNNEFTINMFELREMSIEIVDNVLVPIVNDLNNLRDRYKKERNKDIRKQIWYTIISILPSSWLQRRIVHLNYAVLQNIINQRHNHKLNEWKEFCTTILNSVRYPEFLRKLDYELDN